MDTPDNGTRYLIHKIGTRRINLRGTGMRYTLPAGEWWNGAEWTHDAGQALALTDTGRAGIELPADGEWQTIYVEVPAGDYWAGCGTCGELWYSGDNYAPDVCGHCRNT